MNSHVTKSNRDRSVLFVMCEFFLVLEVFNYGINFWRSI